MSEPVLFKQRDLQPDASDERSNMLAAYIGAIVLTGIALGIRLLLRPWVGDKVPFAIFYTAIAFIAWRGSVGPALFSLVLGALAAIYFVIPPPFEWKVPNVDVRWSLAVYFFTGGVMILLGTAHRRAESRTHVTQRRVLDREQALEGLLSRMSDGFVIYDNDWRFVYANDQAVRMSHRKREELIGRNVWDLFPENVNTDGHRHLMRCMRDQVPVQYEVFVPRLQRWIEVRAFPSPDGVSLFAADISERKQGEAQREQLLANERSARSDAERASRMKDEFLATVSHELRTPLNAILGWAQLLRSPDPPPQDIRQGLDTMERNARLQAQLIDDLLDMSRINSGGMRLDVQQIDLAEVVKNSIESVRLAAQAREIPITLSPAANLPPLAGDAARLQQVVWNLLSNAIKFTPRGGQVNVTIQAVDDEIHLAVSDNGIGIQPHFMNHLFERFRQADASTTRRHGGLGLGLAIARHLVELHGGSLSAASDGEGKGATFTVRLPVGPAISRLPVAAAPMIAASPAAKPDDSLSLSGVKVLVVDDEADAREMLIRLLGRFNAEVRAAGSAAEAMDQIRTESPDVLVSDIGMPEEDGYTFLKRLRGLPAAQGGAIPAVALTAFARAEDRTRAILCGYQAHLAKPVETLELVAHIAALAGRVSGQSSHSVVQI